MKPALDPLRAVELAIKTHGLLPSSAPVLVAVSGGVDSIVLLHVLHELSHAHHWKLSVAHLNHGLRGAESEADAKFVQDCAEQKGLPCIVERVDVAAEAKARGLSIEMAARQARHTFLARVAREKRIGNVALAHHADDQAELFFLRLFRGAGTEGLAGMKWSSPSEADSAVRLVRPLLGTRRYEISLFAQSQRLRFREDSSNACLDFDRNRIRHRLIPLLQKEFQPSALPAVLRAMQVLRAETDFIRALAEAWLARRNGEPDDLPLLRPDCPFSELPLALQRQCVRIQLHRLGAVADFDRVEALCQKVDAPISMPGGLVIIRDSAGLVRLATPLAAQDSFRTDAIELALTKATHGQVRFGGVNIEWQLRNVRPASRPRTVEGQECFDAQKIGPTVVLRHWRRGDRFWPIGLPSPVKLQDFFTNEKVLRPMRHELILGTTAAGDVFWVEDQRISEAYKVTRATRKRLNWRWQRG